jgi:putative tryptophan/tyrosine transport system substrate-binding protein
MGGAHRIDETAIIDSTGVFWMEFLRRRRAFIKLLGGAAAWPLMAYPRDIPVIGILAAPAAGPLHDQMAAFRLGLSQSGFEEDRNVAIEYRWAEGHYDRLPMMADDLVGRGVAVIVALAPAAAVAAKASTATIPIVFVIGADPVELRLIRSLNQPGGNVTGVNFLINALGGKRLQLIRELVPTAGTVGLLVNPSAPGTDIDRQEAEQVAKTVGQKILVVNATTERDFEAAFARLARERVGALVISPDALFTTNRVQLVALAAHHSLPTIYHLREAVAAGGLMSYGTSITDAHRLAGAYTGRILKGEKAADLPVQQSTKFELVINLRTARALSLNVPDKLLALADEVIE